MARLRKDSCLTAAVALLGCLNVYALSPWTPRNAQEELSIHEDILEAQIIEEDREIKSADTGARSCETTFAVATVTRVFKGSRRIGDRILLGGLPTLQVNFPLDSGSEHLFFLQRVLSGESIADEYRYDCQGSELLRKATEQGRLFAGVYTGYRDFKIRRANGQTTVSVHAYQRKSGWLFLDGYGFDQSMATGNLPGLTLETTSYEKFIAHLQATLATFAGTAN